jgi:hypothetical protein
MKKILIIILLLSVNICNAQQEIHGEVINVDGYRSGGGKGETEKGSKGPADKDIGGKDKEKAKADKAAQATTTVGSTKQITTQSIVNEVVALLQEFYGTDFLGTLFSPNFLIPGDAMEIKLKDRLYELELKAGKENRPADAKFLKELRENIIKKVDLKYTFVAAKTSKNSMAFLYQPEVVHNVKVQTPKGKFDGMQITVPGNMLNAVGKQAELIVRFYVNEGAALIANNFETFYKDGKNLVVVGSGVMPVLNNPAKVGKGNLYIPYYALNLIPTKGTRKYNIKAKAFMYINNVEVAVSDYVYMTITY